ncbi:MAG: Ig-like domain-containing protein [Pseudomonadota bacterium]
MKKSRFLVPLLALQLCCLSPAWSQGVPNISRPGQAGVLLAGPVAPEMGRLAVIAWHGDYLFTLPEIPGGPPGDWIVRAWDLSDPANPSRVSITPLTGDNDGDSLVTRHGFMAHGFIKTGDVLSSGRAFRVDGNTPVETNNVNFRMLGWTHGGMSVPWGATNYWSYGETDEPAELYLDLPYGATPNAVFDPVGQTGVIGHPFIFGTTLYYASDQSRSGIASYDISDPSNPVLLDVLTQNSVGGYWPDPFGLNGRLYFFFPHDNPVGGFQVVDATDPTDLQLVASVPLAGNLNYAQFQDEFAFSERYKIDMRTFDVVLELDEEANNRSGERIDTSQWQLPVGNLVVTGGIYINGTCSVPGGGNHCGTGMSIWVHQETPDNRGPFVGYHRPADGETGYPTDFPIQVLIHETLKSETINSSTVLLQPVNGGSLGSPLATELWFSSNDILSIVPEQPLADNTTYQVTLVDDGIEDAVGNGMQGYSFTFSTGSALSGNARPVINSVSTSSSPVSPGTSLQVNVSAVDPDGGSLEYRFDFGDGSTPTDWGSAAQASHSYAEVGHFGISVQVRDAQSAVATGTTGVAVLNNITPGDHRRSRHLARAPDGRIWVINPDNSTVAVLRDGNHQRVAEYRTCADPRSVAFDAAGRAWISCFDADQLIVLESDGRRVATVDTGYGSAPFGVVARSQNNRMLVSLYGSGELALFDAAGVTELDRLALGPTARVIALADGGNRALVTRFISPEDRAEIWDVSVSANGLNLDRTITLAQQWGPDERFDGRGVPNYLASVSITPDGSRAWVAAKKDNTTRGVYLSGEDLDQDNTVRAMVAQIDLASGTELEELRRDLDNSEQPSDIEFSPQGDYAWVSLQGSNVVLVMDTLMIDAGFTGVSSVISRIGVGLAPQSLLLEPGTDILLSHNFLDRQVSRVNVGSLLSTGSTSFSSSTRDLVGREALTVDVKQGKEIFYNAADERMSGEGYMTCATCHIDGGHDGRSWDFSGRGEGVRNTTDLRGRSGTGHGLVHWSANFDEIQDFENDIRGAFGGTGFLTEPQFNQTSNTLGTPKAGLNAELDQLAAYVASLTPQTVPRSPQRRSDGGLTSAAQRGRDIFASQGCANCHSGAERVQRTDLTLALEDLGTTGTDSGGRLGGNLAGIDVPTLNGIWDTPSYLHDGSQPTLELALLSTGDRAWQAEQGSLSGSTDIRFQSHWAVDDLAVLRGGEYVNMDDGSAVTFDVNVGGATDATLTMRYHANYGDANLTLTINGSNQSVQAPRTLANDWMFRQWGEMSLPIQLSGGSNTVRVRYDNGGSFGLDEIRVSDTASQVSRSTPHSRVADLSGGDFSDLLAFLRQLDARPDNPLTVQISTPGADFGVSGTVSVTGTASGAVDRVDVALANGHFVAASGTDSWSADVSAQGVEQGWQVITVRAHDTLTGTWVETQRQINLGASGPPALIFINGFE